MKKKLSLILFSLVLAFSLSGFLTAFNSETAYANETLDWLEEHFFEDENEISFKKYEGQLTTLDPAGYDSGITESKDLKSFILKIVNFALGFLGIFAVLIVIYGGVLYVSAAGEEDRATKGKKAIGYAIIGLLIVMGSFALVNTVIKGALLGGGDGIDDNGTTVKSFVGENVGGSYNAISSNISEVAKEIFSGYVVLVESTEALKDVLSELDKPSLKYEKTLIKKNDMLNFITALESKLKKIQNSVKNFSEPYLYVNTMLRELEIQRDNITSINENLDNFAKVTGSEIEWCKGESDDCLENGYIRYPKPLWSAWRNQIVEPLTQGSTMSLSQLVQNIRNQYLKTLAEKFTELEEIFADVSNISVIQDSNSKARELFENMLGYYGLKLTSGFEFAENNEGFISRIKAWDIEMGDPQMAQATNYLRDALENQLKFAELMSKIQTVDARLRANVITGSAPLTVRFDVLESIDPAGGSLSGANINWTNIKGTYTDENNQIPKDINIDEAVECLSEGSNEVNKELLGNVYKKCTFKYPGTYRATVVINSNDPSKFAAGMSTVVIKVIPPKTKIELTVNSKTVMSYYEKSSILKYDKSYVSVSLKEAQEGKGIKFDASKTKLGNLDVKSYIMNFGDGTEEESTEGIFYHKYNKEGNYDVRLQVFNKLGEVDIKEFTLNIRKVAAFIEILPREGKVNQVMTFDGSRSQSTKGNIKSYEWSLMKGGKILDMKGNTNKKRFVYTFEEPGQYTVNLKVYSDIDNETGETTEQFFVESNPPIASFSYEIKDDNQPSTFQFNADNSFDPDSPDTNLLYNWTIEALDNTNANSWIAKDSNGVNSLTGKYPIVTFKNKGEYKVTLTVTDALTIGFNLPEKDTFSQTINVEDTLDVKWAENLSTTGVMEDGKATVSFDFESINGVAYEIEYGDGESDSGKLPLNAPLKHSYTAAGKYNARVTVYDSDDNDKTILRSVFISDDQTPIAKIRIFVNDAEIFDTTQNIKVSKQDQITFDASDSKNTDGTGRKLKYSWNLGNTISSEKIKNNYYKEKGEYKVTLKVFDSDDPEKSSEDSLTVEVVNSPPTFTGFQVVPETQDGQLITPIKVNLKLFGADDPDGNIVQYRWWYYDDPEDPKGIQITTVPEANLTIGTNGKEGYTNEYKFGVEITDSDNLKVSSLEKLSEKQIPSIKVKNGPNKQPIAKFNVDKTKILVGEKINFSSSSTDEDDKIVKYIWDFEGDGFHNNQPTDKSSVEHTYTSKNLEGFSVKLKVIDSQGGEAVSPPVKIFVDSEANPPKAAFKHEVIPGSNGQKVKFINNSTSDTGNNATLVKYIWDFDTASELATADSDGDGQKDNDQDSTAKEPERLYTTKGTYKVKLTVIDSQGGTDDVINEIKVPLANAPKAAFTHTVNGNTVQFKNNSTADSANQAELTKYIWDFDTTKDTDGDSIKDNDKDSMLKDPKYSYETGGTKTVKLTVFDDKGNDNTVTNTVNLNSTSVTPENKAPSDLKAVLKTDPKPATDGVIYLNGESGSVKFDFSQSDGNIAFYIFDKNINFDTGANGIKHDDEDFKTPLPGTWKTNFEKSWGKISVKLTVVDIYGNEMSTVQEIKFK